MFKKIIEDKYNIGITIYLFCFLFAPPIIKNLNFIFVLFAYSLVMIILKYRKEVKDIIKNKIFIKALGIFCIYCLIFVLSILLNKIFNNTFEIKNFIINIYSLFLFIPVTLICSIYVVLVCKKRNIDFEGVMKLLIRAGLIQAAIAIITLISPAIKEVLVRIMYLNTGERLLNIEWITTRRFYGFANNMLDLFGFGTGIIAALPIVLAIKTNKFKYILQSLILLIVPVLNSRSGIVVYAIAVLAIIIYVGIKNKKIPGVFVKFCCFAFIGGILMVALVWKFSPNTIDWTLRDFKSFFMLDETNSGTATVLFSRGFWQIPPIKNLLIGTGQNISGYSDYAVTGIEHSDVGYINELWKVGIIGSLVIYYLIYYMLKQGFKSTSNIYNKSIFLFLGITTLVFLVKGTMFNYNTATAVIFTLFISSIFIKENIDMKE